MNTILKRINLNPLENTNPYNYFLHKTSLNNQELRKKIPQVFHASHTTGIEQTAARTHNRHFEKQPTHHKTDSAHSLTAAALSTPSLVELGTSLGIGTVSLCFTTTPFAVPLIFGAIAVQTISNTIFRYYRSLDTASGQPGRTTSICNYMCPTIFSYLTIVHLQTLIHELGHALAARAVFKNAAPSITLHPFQGGATAFSIQHLSSLGKMLGKSGALCFVAAMGPVCALVVSATAITIGYLAEHKFPELSSYLIAVGNGDFFAHAFYAFTALDASCAKASHDFHCLAGHGLHPLAATVAILAIPMILSMAFKQRAKEPDFPNIFARI